MRFHRCRSAALAAILALGCGENDPLVAGGGEGPGVDRDRDPSSSVDAGAGGAGRRDSGSGPGSKPSSPGSSPISMDPRDAAEDEHCGKESFRTSPVTPDIMIVLDRSGSMRPGGASMNLRCDRLDMLDPITQVTRAAECTLAGINCDNDRDRNTVNCGGTEVRIVDRWAPSVAAIKKLTTDFDENVRFGLITFPGEGGGRGGGGTCTPGSLQVPIDLGSAGMIAAVLDRTQPNGGTPTGEALQTALTEFQKRVALDSVMPERYVLLVTDGQPTCPNARGGQGGNTDADKQLTISALDALSKEGIKTFVIGYDAALDPQFSMALTEFAQHGGTDRYYAVQDEMSLAEAFKTISSAVISCEMEISSSFTRPEYVNVNLDGNKLVLDDPNGYRIEGRNVIVQGDACTTLQSGLGHKIEVMVDCQRLE